jgi:hypothetical protein
MTIDTTIKITLRTLITIRCKNYFQQVDKRVQPNSRSLLGRKYIKLLTYLPITILDPSFTRLTPSDIKELLDMWSQKMNRAVTLALLNVEFPRKLRGHPYR